MYKLVSFTIWKIIVHSDKSLIIDANKNIKYKDHYFPFIKQYALEKALIKYEYGKDGKSSAFNSVR